MTTTSSSGNSNESPLTVGDLVKVIGGTAFDLGTLGRIIHVTAKKIRLVPNNNQTQHKMIMKGSVERVVQVVPPVVVVMQRGSTMMITEDKEEEEHVGDQDDIQEEQSSPSSQTTTTATIRLHQRLHLRL
mmetsp:Transcript_25173/g.28788  ORF Transcript_25173/g.28788 Transcript_25173/m.28788 type:complete len:130 (+) Transcript_25173:74-463(+)